MAGKRQHFIPQFLQRGFLTRSQRGREFTCVYRKSGECFQTNIKNVGVEGFFYSAPDHDADNVITTAENDLARLLDELRDGQADLPEAALLADLFAHLEVRSRHLRESFLQTGTYLVDALLESMSDPEVFEAAIRKMLSEDPSLLEDAFTKELRKQGIPQHFLPMLKHRATPLIESALPAVAAQMREMATHLRSYMPSRIQEAAKIGHIRALEREVAPAKKAALFSNLHYQLYRFREPSLVLGDSMVLFHVQGGRRFKPFLEKVDDLVAALLPIAADTVLVGAPEHYVPDADRLCLEMARCSLEFFIASEKSERNARLSYQIAENAHLLSEREVQEMVLALLKE